MTIPEAVALFDAGKYEAAFEEFASIYNQSNNVQERMDIMSMLKEAYYAPNESELQECYEKNRQLLLKYPYFWGKKPVEFSGLSFLIFPVSEEKFYLYDKAGDRFVGIYDGISRQQMRYFFENLDHALKVEDEDNLHNLTFLFDNVRRSEDVAMDNHIYLLYNSWEPLQRLMQAGDLAPLLKYNKFVFLIGKESHGRYPVDFKKEFGIDYESMRPQRLRMEEMKRICYWWKRGYAGTMLGIGVLDKNSTAVAKMCNSFHNTTVQGHPLYLTNFFYDLIKNVESSYTLDYIINLYHHKDFVWRFSDFEEFYAFIRNYDEHRSYSVPELFRLYFIFLYYQKMPNANPRVVPVIVWEPHLNDQTVYVPVVMTFPYRIVLNSMREPVTLTGRIYQSEQNIFPYSDYTIAMNMGEELRPDYYVYRFEDLKKSPKETIQAICKTLNLPYEEAMLEAEVPYNSPHTSQKDEVVRGFDQAPLHRNIDSVLSKFDQIRLQIFYDPILKHYGYPRFNFDECPMDDQDVYYLLKFPLRFEADYIASGKENITAEKLRQQLYKNMCKFWNMAKEGKIFLPKVIRPNMGGTGI